MAIPCCAVVAALLLCTVRLWGSCPGAPCSVLVLCPLQCGCFSRVIFALRKPKLNLPLLDAVGCLVCLAGVRPGYLEWAHNDCVCAA